jgi:hypothetical protein
MLILTFQDKTFVLIGLPRGKGGYVPYNNVRDFFSLKFSCVLETVARGRILGSSAHYKNILLFFWFGKAELLHVVYAKSLIEGSSLSMFLFSLKTESLYLRSFLYDEFFVYPFACCLILFIGVY